MSYLIAAAIGLAIGVSSFFVLPPPVTDTMSEYLQPHEEESSVVLGVTNRDQQRKVIGFLPFWLTDQARTDFDTYISQLAFFGLIINTDGTVQEKINRWEQEPGWTSLNSDRVQQQLTEAREQGVELSLVIMNMDNDEILKLLTDPEEHAQTLIEEVTPIMQEYGFTDLHVDIESVAAHSDKTRADFVTFIQELRNGVDENELGTLSIDVIARSPIDSLLTDVSALAPYVDNMIVMTYDYHYMGSKIAGPVAPINGTGIKREYDVESAIQKIRETVPEEKIVLGIPLYGYGWDSIHNQPGSATIKGTGKVITHKQAMQILSDCDDTCITGVDPDYKQPYIVLPSDDGDGPYYRQIFYEDAASLNHKFLLVEKYNLGGIALWALGYEDEDIHRSLQEYWR